MDLKTQRRKLNNLLVEYKYAVQLHKEEKENLHKAQKKVAQLQQALDIVQRVAEKIQNKAVNQLASIVTTCLQMVFGDSYAFTIRFVRKRNKTEANLILLKDGQELDDPLEEEGGGVCDVLAFGLRLACLLLTHPRRRKLLVLDESFKHLSSEYHPVMANLLMFLAKKLNVQIILITHSPGLQIGTVVDLENL